MPAMERFTGTSALIMWLTVILRVSPSLSSDPHATAYLPVTRLSDMNPPGFVVTVTFYPDNDSTDVGFTTLLPQDVNLTLDSSCNHIILTYEDCSRLRLQDMWAMSCNSTAASCSANGESVYPTQAPIKLSYIKTSASVPAPSPCNQTYVPMLCSSGRSLGTAGIAPYRLSLVVQIHGQLQSLSLPKVFGYCLGKPNGYFFVGQPDYNTSMFMDGVMSYIPTLRWDKDHLPLLSLTGIVLHTGDGNTSAPMDETVLAEGLRVGTRDRYMSLADPVYQWLKVTMTSIVEAAGLSPTESPFQGLELCYPLSPSLWIPQLELQFAGNQSWLLDPYNLLEITEDEQTFCLGVMSGNTSSVLGSLQQEENIVEFNFDQQTVGVSGYLPRVPSGCDQLY